MLNGDISIELVNGLNAFPGRSGKWACLRIVSWQTVVIDASYKMGFLSRVRVLFMRKRSCARKLTV